jgi:hypothetical protein
MKTRGFLSTLFAIIEIQRESPGVGKSTLTIPSGLKICLAIHYNFVMIAPAG